MWFRAIRVSAFGASWSGTGVAMPGLTMKLTSLLRLARKSIAGLTELGVTLNVTHTTLAQLTALYDDTLAKNVAYQAAKSGKLAATATLGTARDAAEAFVEKTRDFLKPRYGSLWSEDWPQVGFAGPSLSLPLQDEERANTLLLMKTYFVAHPTHEGAAYGLTALQAEAVLTAFLAAVQGTVDCAEDRRTTADNRRESVKALLKKLRGLWNELESVMEDLDPRWLKFMDRIPGDPRVPEAVEELTAEAQPGGIIVLDWEDASRAASYKVYKQVVGVDEAPVLALTVDESDAQLTDLPAGATVKLLIVATNAAGDAPASEEIELQAA